MKERMPTNGAKVCSELMECFWGFIRDATPAMVTATFGSIAHALLEHKDEWSWKEFGIGIFVAAFVGWLLSRALETTGFPESMKSAAIAIGGYSSKDVIRLVSLAYTKKLEKILKKECE